MKVWMGGLHGENMHFCIISVNAEMHGEAARCTSYGANMQEDWSLTYVRHVLAALDVAPSALAEMANVSSTTLTRPLNSDAYSYRISPRTLDKIQEATGIPYASFASGGQTPPQHLPATRPDISGRDYVSIDKFDIDASAGNGVIPDDYPEVADRLTFPRDYLRTITSSNPANLSIIGVKGDSMLDTLQHGDVVMIDRSKTSLSYDGLFVLNLDGALHVKRVARAGRPGWVSIVSDNKRKYAPFERDADEVHVVGKVIWKGTRE